MRARLGFQVFSGNKEMAARASGRRFSSALRRLSGFSHIPRTPEQLVDMLNWAGRFGPDQRAAFRALNTVFDHRVEVDFADLGRDLVRRQRLFDPASDTLSRFRTEEQIRDEEEHFTSRVLGLLDVAGYRTYSPSQRHEREAFRVTVPVNHNWNNVDDKLLESLRPYDEAAADPPDFADRVLMCTRGHGEATTTGFYIQEKVDELFRRQLARVRQAARGAGESLVGAMGDSMERTRDRFEAKTGFALSGAGRAGVDVGAEVEVEVVVVVVVAVVQ